MPRAVRRPSAGLSAELERISRDLSLLTERVRHVEGIKDALDAYSAGMPKRRGRPPGSKNTRPRAASKNGRRRRGRPRKTAVTTTA